MKLMLFAALALLTLTACGQSGPLVQPGEGRPNTQYIIKGSNTPAAKPAPPADAAPQDDNAQ